MRSSILVLAAATTLSIALAGCSKKDEGGAAPGSSAAPTAKLSSPLSGTFEGTILLHVDGKGSEAGPFDMEVSVKNDAVRFDMPKKLLDLEKRMGEKAWAVFRASDKKAFFATEPSKTVYTIDFDAAGDDIKRAVPPVAPPGGGAGTKATVKRTGKKDTVAGIACEEWEIKDGDSSGLVCMAEENAGWLKIPTKALPDDVALAAELLDGKHFPLRAIGFSKGQESGRLEVKRIEKKTLSDADFQVPQSFQRVDVLEMLKAFGGMGKQGPAMGGPPGSGFPKVAPAKSKK